MKTLTLFFALSLVLLGNAAAQTVKGPADFVDIPWGATEQVVRENMKAREGVKFGTDDPGKNKTVWHGGTLVGQPVQDWHLWVTNGKFAQGQATIAYSPEKTYAALKQQLIAQYGRPKTEKAARGESEPIWVFAVSQANKEPTSIILKLGPDRVGPTVVRLFYRNDALWTSGAPALGKEL